MRVGDLVRHKKTHTPFIGKITAMHDNGLTMSVALTEECHRAWTSKVYPALPLIDFEIVWAPGMEAKGDSDYYHAITEG